MELNLNDVKEYLLETNAVEEAESIILHNILRKSNESLQKKVVKDSLGGAAESKKIQENTEKLDNLKISDLLGSLEEEYKRSVGVKKSASLTADQPPISHAERQAQQLEKLKLFDEVAAQELTELEKKRDWVQLKKLSNKYELDKYNIINKPDDSAAARKQEAALAATIPFPKNSHDTMGKLYELTEEHARKMALNRAEALTLQKEREQLNKGNWSLRTSYLNTQLTSSTSAPSMASSEAGDTGFVASKRPFSEANLPSVAEPQPERLQSILMSVATNEAMEAQKREIEELRKRAAQSDQSLRSDPVLHAMSSLIKQAHSTEEAVDPQSHVVKRGMSVPQYLNKWLKLPESEEASGPVPMHLPASSAAAADPETPTVSQYKRQPSSSNVLTASGLQSVQSRSSPASQPPNVNGPASMQTIRAAPQPQSHPKIPAAAPDSSSGLQDEDDPVQALVARLLEDNRKLQQEKEELLRGNNRLSEAAPKASAMRSPERPHGGPGAGGAGALNQFRSRSYVQPAQPPFDYPPQQALRYPHEMYPTQMGQYEAPHPGVHRPSPYHNQYSQPFPNPYAQPYAQSHPGMHPPNFGPTPGMGMPGGGLFNPAPADPQLMQLQQMAEQMERENGRLMSQLGLAPSPEGQQLGANPAAGGMDPGAPADGRRNIVDNSQLFTLERDKNRNQPKPSRMEVRHQEEVRKIQQEIEKIKYQGELDIAQAEYEQSRSKRLKELEHEKWLQQQKQELQALKIQQVLAKEQRMLRLHQEDSSGSGGGGDGGNNAPQGAKSTKAAGQASGAGEAARSGSALARERAREECGVGRAPVPLDLATGITVIVDGIVLPRSMQEGNLFRIALGLFDKAGKALVRLTASQWQSWSAATANDKQEGAVQLMKELLTRTLKLSETKVDLWNARCLLELQTKDSMDGAQRGVGWAVMPLVRTTTGSNVAVNTAVSKENVALCNNTWRAVLRKSLSDPAVPDLFAPPEQAVFESWFLVRVLDSTAKQQASSWSLADSLCQTEKQALDLYSDVMGAREADNAKLDDGQKLLEKDPEIKGLFSSGSKSPIGFSQRGSAADLQAPDAGPGGVGAKGALAAMKAVGLFKSRSKGNLKSVLENIAEEEGKATERPDSVSRRPPMSSMSTRGLQPPGSAQRVMTPSSPALAAFGGLSRKVPDQATTAEAPVVEDVEDKSKDLLRAADDKKYWFLGKPLGPCNDKYQKGDGVDFYIDSGMFLPDNCTLSRITMRLFASDKEQVGAVHECFSLPNSPSTAPVFKFKAEFRLSSFNMTTTALIRIDTVDAATLLPASVGYCCIKLFASRERVQPRTPTELNACINTGNFQVPLHAGRIPTNLVVMNDTMLSTLPKIPAASLLVRILPAPKSADGISTLSKDEFPSTEWARLGLDVPAPTYVSGEYNGSLCEPADIELVSYRAKSQNPAESVESALLQAITARPTEAIALPPKPAGSESDAVLAWMKQLLPPHDQMRRSIEYAYAIPYSVESGLNVAVDRLYNMPEAGIFTSHSTLHKVIASLTPPGLFYKDPPLFDGVQYTRTHGLDAHMRAPVFSDGFYDFVPSTLNASLYLILDIRTIRIEVKKAGQDPKITLEPPSERKSYWTLLPLSMEKVPGQGHRYISSGVYHLPLIEGTVPAEGVFKAANPYKELCARLSAKGKGLNNLKVMEGGGMVAIRVMNPLLKDLVTPEMTGPKPIIHTEFMEDLLTHAISGNSASSARIDRFAVDTAKLQVGGTNGGKSTALQLPKSCQADLPALLRTVNREFETATGLVAK
jgi:hypothetical protein